MSKLTFIGIIFLLIDLAISAKQPLVYFHTYLAVRICLIVVDQFKMDRGDKDK